MTMSLQKGIFPFADVNNKTRKNFRFTAETNELIDTAAQATGLTQTDLIEMLVNDFMPDVVKNLSDRKVAAMKLALKEYQKRVNKQ